MKHKVLTKKHIPKMCFVCGVNNDCGLRPTVNETDTNELVALIRQRHQS